MTTLASSVLAWLLTYLIHSTVLLGVAWLVTRTRRLEPAAWICFGKSHCSPRSLPARSNRGSSLRRPPR